MAITKGVKSSLKPLQSKTIATKSNPLTSVTTIAIDAMGGDFGPPVTIPASLEILAKYPKVRLILVGDIASLQAQLRSHSYDAERLTLQHASQQVEMDEMPSHALRTKKDS